MNASSNLVPSAQPDVERLRDALRGVIDPEAGMNIVDLGLVYRLEVDGARACVDLTMTSSACPLGEMLIDKARAALEAVLPTGFAIDIQLVWSPPWSPELMSDEARQHFGW